jgi:hypothetical protein
MAIVLGEQIQSCDDDERMKQKPKGFPSRFPDVPYTANEYLNKFEIYGEAGIFLSIISKLEARVDELEKQAN